ncbi:MAG: 50S ribosomal protein L24 [Candidatus Diapherotrites archaeon]
MVKSKKPKKQRKAHYNAKLHVKRKQFSAHLSTELRKALGKRSLPVRTGDKVKVMRGKNKKFSGKILRLNRAKNQVFIEKLNRKKSDGTEILIPIRPSNLMLVELDRSDEKRMKVKIPELKAKKEETKAEKAKGTSEEKPKNVEKDKKQAKKKEVVKSGK